MCGVKVNERKKREELRELLGLKIVSLMPKKTWWDCVKNDVENLGLSQKDAQSRNKWRGELRGQPANPCSLGKMVVKTECACVCVC